MREAAARGPQRRIKRLLAARRGAEAPDRRRARRGPARSVARCDWGGYQNPGRAVSSSRGGRVTSARLWHPHGPDPPYRVPRRGKGPTEGPGGGSWEAGIRRHGPGHRDGGAKRPGEGEGSQARRRCGVVHHLHQERRRPRRAALPQLRLRHRGHHRGGSLREFLGLRASQGGLPRPRRQRAEFKALRDAPGHRGRQRARAGLRAPRAQW
mmetsp:Transcript_14792/g.34885  ORF Transcript_14792/g.34885 Transcript_14792/m.34885 type:complete len:210 (-) Transcript_14792:494-1123(-)